MPSARWVGIASLVIGLSVLGCSGSDGGGSSEAEAGAENAGTAGQADQAGGTAGSAGSQSANDGGESAAGTSSGGTAGGSAGGSNTGGTSQGGATNAGSSGITSGGTNAAGNAGSAGNTSVGGESGGQAPIGGNAGQAGQGTSNQGWYEVGGSATGEGVSFGTSGDDPSVVIDVLGHPMVAWVGFNPYSSIYLRHFNGSEWNPLGVPGSVDLARGCNGDRAELRLDSHERPIVAWVANSARLRTWAGRAWGPLGDSAGDLGASQGPAEAVSMVLDSSNAPVLAYLHETSTSQSEIYLRKFDGQDYIELQGSAAGTGLSGDGWVYQPGLTLDADGNPVVVWRRLASGVSSLQAIRYTGSQWEPVNDGLPTSGVFGTPRITSDASGRPVVVIAVDRSTSSSFACDLTVMRLEDGTWQGLDGSADPGGIASFPNCYDGFDLARDDDGLVVTWAAGGRSNVFLKRYDEVQGWYELAGSATDSGISNTPSADSEYPAVTARDGRICVAWDEVSSGVYLRCFDRTSWDCACDTSSACDSGCDCDPGCRAPDFDDFSCESGLGYRCDDGTCVALDSPCDGVEQCPDGSDESPLCPNGTDFNLPRGDAEAVSIFPCLDGSSSLGSERCDGVATCLDGSDEDAICGFPSPLLLDPTGSVYDLYGVWAGPSGAWASGDFGVVLHRDPTGWARQEVNAGTWNLGPCWGSGDSWLLVEWAGTSLIWDGSIWDSAAIASYSSVTGFWGLSPSDTWATGFLYEAGTGFTTGGATFHYTGDTWAPIDPAGVTTPLRSINGTANDDIWTVGDEGVILHYNGSSWQAETSPTQDNLYAVWSVARDDVWIAGADGVLLHDTGSGWQAQPQLTRARLYGLWAKSASDVWAVGSIGTVLHYDGSSWTHIWSGTSTDLSAVYGADGVVYAVGREGLILVSPD